jgi:hypothetical protein
MLLNHRHRNWPVFTLPHWPEITPPLTSITLEIGIEGIPLLGEL